MQCGSVMGYNPSVTLSSNFHLISGSFYRDRCLFLKFTALVTLSSNWLFCNFFRIEYKLPASLVYLIWCSNVGNSYFCCRYALSGAA